MNLDKITFFILFFAVMTTILISVHADYEFFMMLMYLIIGFKLGKGETK